MGSMRRGAGASSSASFVLPLTPCPFQWPSSFVSHTAIHLSRFAFRQISSANRRKSPRSCILVSSANTIPTGRKGCRANAEGKFSTARDHWHENVGEGAVVEVWQGGRLHFGIVKNVHMNTVEIFCLGGREKNRKVDFGEIVSVWPEGLRPRDENELERYVGQGLDLIKNSKPRTLSLDRVYEGMTRFKKNDVRGMKSSFELASSIFPLAMSGAKERQAAATAATALLVSGKETQFRRADPGYGWRALRPSVSESAKRISFVEAAQKVIALRTRPLEGHQKEAGTKWTREHLEMLRALEIAAASGLDATGNAAATLKAFGYPTTAFGASKFLFTVGYWTESAEGMSARGGDGRENAVTADIKPFASSQGFSDGGRRADSLYEWSCPPAILLEARELREAARRRRQGILTGDIQIPDFRRDFSCGGQYAVYCIDEKSTRFLDDAVSIERLEPKSVVRVSVHVADVDELVRSGSAIDRLARERGKSLYLPLSPLHMIPASAMDAASFSSSFPTEAISVSVEVDTERNEVLAWEICASVVPPVCRVTYEQYDTVLNGQEVTETHINDAIRDDLVLLGSVVPIIAETFDTRKRARRQRLSQTQLRASTGEGQKKREEWCEKRVAVVRLQRGRQRRRGRQISSQGVRVREFKEGGAHGVVGALLTSVGSLFRRYAGENGVALPEVAGAENFASRCGTAPLRRYADLAVQRQVKSVLMHREPAGRRRMQELRVWLTKRHLEGDRAVTSQRRRALYDSFAGHCDDQQRASGLEYALVTGRVTTSALQRKKIPRAGVALEGTGLTTSAVFSQELLRKKGSQGEQQISGPEEFLLPVGSKVQVKIWEVDLKAFQIKAEIVKSLS